MKILYAVATLLLLTGCRASFWAQPPLPHGGCDPATRGTWFSAVEYSEEGDAMQIGISFDANCSLVANSYQNNVLVHRSEPAQVGMGRLQGQSYAWMDANTLLEYGNQGHRTRDGYLIVFRYRIQNDELWVWNINHEHVSRLVAAGRIRAEQDDGEFHQFNLIEGPVAPELLGAPEFFADATVFSRKGGPQ